MFVRWSIPSRPKERFSSELLDEAINWTSIAVRVPPNRMPRLSAALAGVDADALRRAAASLRRRLLWTSIYGNCELGDHGTCPERGACQPPPHGCAPELTARSDSRICALFTLTEGGELDAFDTLMQVLRIPRVHFQLSDAHRAPRAPELHRALGGWLRSLEGGARCATNGRLL